MYQPRQGVKIEDYDRYPSQNTQSYYPGTRSYYPSSQTYYPSTGASTGPTGGPWHSGATSFQSFHPARSTVGYQNPERNIDYRSPPGQLNLMEPSIWTVAPTQSLPHFAASQLSSMYQPSGHMHMGHPAQSEHPWSQYAQDTTVSYVSSPSISNPSASGDGATNLYAATEPRQKKLKPHGHDQDLKRLQESLVAYLEEKCGHLPECGHLTAIMSSEPDAREYIPKTIFNDWWKENEGMLRLLPLLDPGKAFLHTDGSWGGKRSDKACYDCFLGYGGFYELRNGAWQTCMCAKDVVRDRLPGRKPGSTKAKKAKKKDKSDAGLRKQKSSKPRRVTAVR